MSSSSQSKPRVLVVNKFFFPNAGAETVFFLERQLLRDRGHAVVDFAMASERNVASEYSSYFARERSYEDVSPLVAARNAASSVYSFDARRRFARLIRDTTPDVIHFHNIYHQLTLSLVDGAVAAGVPTVLTLHDYKIGCPSYDLYRDGQICHQCVGASPTAAFKYRCVKGSRAASGLAYMEARLAGMRGLYKKVDVLIAPSQFAASIAEESGFDAGRIRFAPNFLPASEFVDEVDEREVASEPLFVFAGRLEEVKGILGVAEMFGAGKVPGKLRILGDGPLAKEIEAIALRSDAVEFVGRVPRERVREEYRMASAALFPSLWEENCPMSLLEARAAGTAVVCSDSGGLPSFVTHEKDGLLVAPGSMEEWQRALCDLAEKPSYAADLARTGLVRLKRDHSPDPHYRQLVDAYSQALDRHR